MNCVTLLGRMTVDPELDRSKDPMRCTFTIAVDKPFAKKDAEDRTWFFNCVAWRQKAEAIANSFRKGQRICIRGSIDIYTYTDKEGVKRKATQIVVEEFDFCESKSSTSPQDAHGYSTPPRTPQAAPKSATPPPRPGGGDDFFPTQPGDQYLAENAEDDTSLPFDL
jgi:single-strand DNA-binding protein